LTKGDFFVKIKTPRTNFCYLLRTEMYYVYLIKNERGELYYGFTGDLSKRLDQHNNSESFSTAKHRWRLIYYEAYLDKMDAKNREKKLKHYGQSISHLKRRLNKSLNKN